MPAICVVLGFCVHPQTPLKSSKAVERMDIDRRERFMGIQGTPRARVVVFRFRIISKSTTDKIRHVNVKYRSMFTGIIEQTGTLTEITATSSGTRLTLTCEGWKNEVVLGESICTSGCCLTVAGCSGEQGNVCLTFDVIPQTLQCTTLGNLTLGAVVNLERSLTSESLLGGHFVQGHVDGVETISTRTTSDTSESRIRISMDSIDPDAIVSKGSVTIEGVSLTIANVGENWFEVAIIPTTDALTTLGELKEGDQVNVETDIVARTIAHVVRRMK